MIDPRPRSVDLRGLPRHDGGLTREDLSCGDGTRRGHGHSRGFRRARAATTQRSEDHRLGPRILDALQDRGDLCRRSRRRRRRRLRHLGNEDRAASEALGRCAPCGSGPAQLVLPAAPRPGRRVQARGQQEPRGDAGDHPAVADQGRALGAAAFRPAQPAGANVKAARLRAQPAIRREGRGQVGRPRSRGGHRRGARVRRHGALERGMARAFPRSSARCQAHRRDHQDRRERSRAAAEGRPALERHSRLGPHADPGRTDGCAHAGRAWRRRADGDRRASAANPGARPRYQPRQAQLLPRSCPQGGRRPTEGR